MFRFGLSKDGKTFQAKKFDGLTPASEKLEPAKDTVLAVVLDIETTGLSKDADEIIELGARKILVHKETGQVLLAGEAFSALAEPSQPLSPFIKTLTGLTDLELKGKSIDWKLFDEFISGAALIVAHNAAFDRPFVDKKSSASREKIWACSSFQVKWNTWFSSAKLEFLCLLHGFFYESHRALSDVDALIHLLSFPLPENEVQTYFFSLFQNAKKKNFWLSAANSPYESRNILKKNGYKWTGQVWRKRVQEDDLKEEKAFLEKKIYAGRGFLGDLEEIAIRDNFKE